MSLSPAALVFICLLFVTCNNPDNKHTKDYTGWRTYAGSKDGIRYSSNDQINTENVGGLKVAWTYSTNDKDTGNKTQNQCNPIVIDGVLYGTSPRLKLFALDAATGKQKWLFDPASLDSLAKRNPSAYFKVNRGVTYWRDEEGNDRRLFYSVGSKTFAINADDGKPVSTFGRGGFIELSDNLDRENISNKFMGGTTPGIIFKDLLIIGMMTSEDADAPPGHVRAFDTRTGERRWIFHTIPHPGDVGYDTWPDKEAWKKLGGANSWAGMSLDEKRGIVYVPTGTVSGDFYGGIRKGQNLFGNSLIALNAADGKYLWHYQVVHHDLWDRDLAANPNLVTLNRDGHKIDAVAQITKHGYVFLFNRQTGEPLFEIQEKPVPQNALPGEEPWPTQPIPTLPEPFARQKFLEEDVTDLDPETHAEMLEKFRKIKYTEAFTPPSKDGVWIFPGFDGGGEWGGSAVDPETQILYVNSSEMPWSLTMIDVPKKPTGNSVKEIGRSVYNRHCISCHGPNLEGNGPAFPALKNISQTSTEEQVRQVIENGRNRMPAFRNLEEDEMGPLVSFLLNIDIKSKKAKSIIKKGEIVHPGGSEADHKNSPRSILEDVPYTMTGYNRFLDKNGFPGIKPPWGTLNAVDLNSGKLLWKVPLGEYPELTKRGIPPTGTENYGGPVVTKGGLVFIAASKDAKIRAFDKKSGKILWEAQLPVPGYATPSVYSVEGKQFIVIACGGGKIGSKSGDKYIAFTL